MARNDGQPRIVAELGRPETPEETAARKAENSRKHRANQTTLNLVFALVACLGIVLYLVLVAVRPDQPAAEAVDYAATANQAQSDASEPLIVPALPPDWRANNASLTGESNDGQTWYVGFVTPKTQFVALNQAIDAPDAWLDDRLGSAKQTGETTIAGITWAVFDRRDQKDAGNFAYSLETTRGSTIILLHGTAEDAEFEALATAVAAELPESAQ